jgi:hypothetical protein
MGTGGGAPPIPSPALDNSGFFFGGGGAGFFFAATAATVAGDVDEVAPLPLN